jgi:hypothetical protein
MKPDAGHNQCDDEEDTKILLATHRLKKREYIQLQSSQSRRSSHGVAVGVKFLCRIPINVALVVAEVGVEAVIYGVVDDWMCSYFRAQEREGDDPEDDREDVEAEDRPVVIHDGRSCAGNEDIDCNDHCCKCLDVLVMCGIGGEVTYSEQGQVVAIEGVVGDAIGRETKDCDGGNKLEDSEG